MAAEPGELERAADIVAEGGVTPQDAPSRFGRAGVWARTALLRVLRPYASRQREVDRALLDAIRAAGAGTSVRPVVDPSDRAAVELAAPLPDAVMEVDTDVGQLLLDATDPTITPLIAKHRCWEEDVVAFIREHLGPGMTFLDVGAHIGYFSVLGSRLVGEAGHVFAVEVEPRNLDLLRANLWRNRCDNVTVLPVAAYAERGHVRFVSNPAGLAGSWIDADQGETATMVPCAPLDELL